MIQAGDIVVCVDDSCWSKVPHDCRGLWIEKGGTYRVCWTGLFGTGEPALRVEGDPENERNYAYEPRRFRKVTPATPSFTAMIRRLAPKRTGVAA